MTASRMTTRSAAPRSLGDRPGSPERQAEHPGQHQPGDEVIDAAAGEGERSEMRARQAAFHDDPRQHRECRDRQCDADESGRDPDGDVRVEDPDVAVHGDSQQNASNQRGEHTEQAHRRG